jgi:hypothetical protein
VKYELRIVTKTAIYLSTILLIYRGKTIIITLGAKIKISHLNDDRSLEGLFGDGSGFN